MASEVVVQDLLSSRRLVSAGGGAQQEHVTARRVRGRCGGLSEFGEGERWQSNAIHLSLLQNKADSI